MQKRKTIVLLHRFRNMANMVVSWCNNARITVNGLPLEAKFVADTYVPVNRIWKNGDKVEINFEMQPMLIESNPLVEETRNQTAVKRGPIVYCLEETDAKGTKSIDNILIPIDIKLTPRKTTIAGSNVVVLDGMANLTNENSWKNILYRPVEKSDKKINITLIPYYAWGNRGKMDMPVWMPLVP